MRQFRRRLLIAATASLFVSGASAAETPYLTPKQVDLTVLLPPPPPAKGEIDRAELAFVAATQAAASPERIALGQRDAVETVYAMFASTLGERFREDVLPKTTTFFERIGETEDAVVDPAKATFGRVRPWLASPDVKGYPPTTKSGSYPSGHTTRVTIAAIMLAQILPEKRAELWARANEYAESRVIIGMHYPLDLEGGRRAGTAMATAMLLDPAFRADLDAVRAEVRAALGM